MEVSYISENSIKVKAKNASFVINPDKKIEVDVVFLTKKPDDYVPYSEKIVFDGPGEYEVAGVSIRGEAGPRGTSFGLLEDNERILILSSQDLEKSKEAEDYTATIVLADEPLENETLSNITSEVVIVVGSIRENEAVKKTDKVNLRKIDEYKGFLVHLTKN